MPASVPTILDATSIALAQLERLEQAWNQANGADFGAVFAHDCTFVDIRGGHHRSRSAVIAGHQALFDSLYQESEIRYQLHLARQVAPGCVVAVASATLDAPAGPAQGVHRSRLTAVLTEHKGSWPLAAFHNTLVQEDS